MFDTQRKQEGFTLIELLVVVTIIGIGLTISIPSLSSWMKGMRLNAAAREVFGAFQLARTESVKRNTDVVINFGEGSGENGTWEIFVDDGAGTGTADNFAQDGDEESIASGNIPAGISIDSADFGSSNDEETGYDYQGLPAGGRSGTVEVENDSKAYTITLSPGGSVKME